MRWLAGLLIVGMMVAAAAGEEAATQPAAETLAVAEAATQTAPASQPAAPAAIEEVREKVLTAGFEPLVQRRPGGGIDWTRGVVFAVGEVKAAGDSGQQATMAKRGARVAAARNVLAVLAGLRIDAAGRLAEIREGSVTVDGVLKDFQEVSSSFDVETLTARVRLEAPLCGASGAVSLMETNDVRLTRSQEPVAVAEGGADVVVIDARGCGFVPSLLPEVSGPQGEGEVLFAAGDRLPGEALQRMPALFVYVKQTGVRSDATSVIVGPIARAQAVARQAGTVDRKLRDQLEKAFKAPLILMAQPSPSDRPGALAIAPGSLTELALHAEARELMRQGRLIIVTDYEGD